jgi:hypothetical protein
MSLNRWEQLVFDYVQGHADERHFWEDKVRALAAGAADEHAVATELEGELWRYLEERSRVAEPFRSMAARENLRRTSLRNLAEHLLRMWSPPRAKRPRRPSADGFLPAEGA